MYISNNTINRTIDKLKNTHKTMITKKLNQFIFIITLIVSQGLFAQFEYQNQLPEYLSETSGLCHSNEGLWNINDGGNGNMIYLFPENNYQQWLKTGSFDYNALKTYRLPVKNVDWEAIATDSVFLYIGDFGNNRGNRKDLTIYKIRISELLQLSMPVELDRSTKNPSPSSKNGELVFDFLHSDLIDKIEFEYSDQNKFKERKLHNYDCESMVVSTNQIILLSKNWKNLQSTAYSIPNKAGKYVAKPIGKLNPGFLITDATWCPGGIYVCGYGPSGFQHVAKIDTKKWNITERKPLLIQPAQFEGIYYDPKVKRLILSTEQRKTQPATLFMADWVAQ